MNGPRDHDHDGRGDDDHGHGGHGDGDDVRHDGGDVPNRGHGDDGDDGDDHDDHDDHDPHAPDDGGGNDHGHDHASGDDVSVRFKEDLIKSFLYCTNLKTELSFLL